MRGTIPKYAITLKKKQRKRLTKIVRRRSPSHWLVLRAKIILLSATLRRVDAVCEALSIDRQVVRRWCRRFVAGGVQALKDRPRRGRPATIPAKVWEKVATLVVQPPTNLGLELNRWTVRELSRFLEQRHGWSVSRSSISRFLRKMALKPHRVRYWLNPTDPDFDKKAARICRLYLRPPKGKTVLSIDEKPGVQALERRFPDHAMRCGRVRRAEFEYRRRGTRNIFAAFDIKNGRVVVLVTADRKVPRVIEFLQLIATRYRRGPVILISDNISTRFHADVKAWLAAHPRFSFVFTPYHGSWLNQVELWFGILTAKCLRGRSFASVSALSKAVYRFTSRWNHELAKPFEWTYSGKVLHA
jgi:transposase